MRSEGFTLIELAVVLAIIAVLAAVLTPIVGSFTENGRKARAASDLSVIAEAFTNYYGDVGEWPIWDNSTEAASDTPGKDFIVSARGTNATAGAGDASVWTTNVATTTLEMYINNNYLNKSTTAKPGKVSYQGPYLGDLDSDPWGQKYYVTKIYLQDDSTNKGMAVSAGPDGVLDTDPGQARTGLFTCEDDDICVLIRP